MSSDLQRRINDARQYPYFAKTPYTNGVKHRLYGLWHLRPSGSLGLPVLRGPGGSINLIEMNEKAATDLIHSVRECYGIEEA